MKIVGDHWCQRHYLLPKGEDLANILWDMQQEIRRELLEADSSLAKAQALHKQEIDKLKKRLETVHGKECDTCGHVTEIEQEAVVTEVPRCLTCPCQRHQFKAA